VRLPGLARIRLRMTVLHNRSWHTTTVTDNAGPPLHRKTTNWEWYFLGQHRRRGFLTALSALSALYFALREGKSSSSWMSLFVARLCDRGVARGGWRRKYDGCLWRVHLVGAVP
jgi:hypothetical protein